MSSANILKRKIENDTEYPSEEEQPSQFSLFLKDYEGNIARLEQEIKRLSENNNEINRMIKYLHIENESQEKQIDRLHKDNIASTKNNEELLKKIKSQSTYIDKLEQCSNYKELVHKLFK